MSKGRIGLALGAFAAVAVSLAGSPSASADITDMIVHTDGFGMVDSWNINALITCNPASTPAAPPVYFTDNGKALPGSPGTTGACVTTNGVSGTNSTIAFEPTTVGAHHIVATQYNPDGSVLSTLARDVNVTSLPGGTCQPSFGSYAAQCKTSTGSAGW
ncbi:hypothetical protein [Nocardia sp. NPDC004722]